MPRIVSWFSCGAASAVATKLTAPDVIAYCNTGAEHPDNKRFMADCAGWFGQDVLILQSDKYTDTWDVWEKRNYLSGVRGAPCTLELKVKPRLAFQRDDDVHIFGYTADGPDVKRAEALTENWPDLTCKFPLIDRGITKAACLAMLEDAGIAPPLTYALGFPNANCLPCVKATSPAYWALVRKQFPHEFERVFIDEIPEDHPTTQPIMPDCDFLCSLAEQEIVENASNDINA
jgi:hypothetical protein